MLIASRLPAFRMPRLTPRHWLASLMLATMAALWLFAGLSVTGLRSDGRAIAKTAPISSTTLEPTRPDAAPPVAEPMTFQAIDPADAVAYNASIPVSTSSNPAAKPFVFHARSIADKARALQCLTAAVYYEAGSESTDGQRAVAQVVLNRVRHPAYPNSVCGVVYQGSERATGCQFTFTCDGSLARVPSAAGWKRARDVAEAALAGKVYAPVGYATHYHTDWVVPYWSANLVKVANVGAHIFYRWTGGWGRPAAFTDRASGIEPDPAVLRTASASSSPETVTAAEAAANPDAVVKDGDEVAAHSSIDSFQRAVLRRYEPIKEEAAAKAKAAIARADLPPSTRWALTGDAPGPTPAPLGDKVAASSPVASASKPNPAGSAR